MVQQSDDPSQENPGQASGDRLLFPGPTRNLEVTEPEASDVEVFFLGMPKREQQNASASSGRNKSPNPNAQASGDRLQYTVKVDEGRDKYVKRVSFVD